MPQLGTTNISLFSVGNLLTPATVTNISLTAIQVATMGSKSTIYADASASKVSVWFISNCKSSVSNDSTVPYITGGTGGLNPTRDITSTAYTGWIYDRNDAPWRPSKISDFKVAAQSRPLVTVTKIGTGNPSFFNLQLNGSFITATGATITPSPIGSNIFYFWIEGPGANFILKRWRVSDAGGEISIPNCVPGSYVAYVQDAYGSGNQFEFLQNFVYP